MSPGDSISVRNNNPMNVRPGGGDWQGMTGSADNFVTFSSPEYGVRAGLQNHITHNNRNLGANRENSVYTLLSEATPYAENRDFWDGGGADRLAQELGVGLHDNIDLRNEGTGRAFGEAVIRMEMGPASARFFNNGSVDRGFDLVYGSSTQQ